MTADKRLLEAIRAKDPKRVRAGIAAGADGTLYVSGDAEGSVLAICPQ